MTDITIKNYFCFICNSLCPTEVIDGIEQKRDFRIFEAYDNEQGIIKHRACCKNCYDILSAINLENIKDIEKQKKENNKKTKKKKAKK